MGKLSLSLSRASRWMARALLILSLSWASAACSGKKAATTPADYAAQDPLVAHESFEIRSELLGDLRKIAVYVPPQYKNEPTRQFPVLFFPDGGLKQDFPHISHAIDQLIAQGKVPPMLVVGVESQDRYKELTTPAQSRHWRKRLPQAGGAAKYHAFFEQELKPEIARRYRIQGMPHALIGESLAGRWVVDGWTQNPERYDLWIAIDPSLWWNDKELLHELDARVGGALAHRASRLYLSGAYLKKRGSLPDVYAFVNELKTLGVGAKSVIFESYPALDHAEIFRSTERHIYEEMFRAWGSNET